MIRGYKDWEKMVERLCEVGIEFHKDTTTKAGLKVVLFIELDHNKIGAIFSGTK